MPEQRTGLQLQRLLHIGTAELALARSVADYAAHQQLLANTAGHGLITRRLLGGLGLAWKVVQPTAGGDLVVMFEPPGPFSQIQSRNTAVDRAGEVLVLDPDVGAASVNYRTLSDITVPDDGTWRTLVARFVRRTTEPGTVSFSSGSTTLTGVGTTFTRLTSRDDLVSTTVQPTADQTFGATLLRVASGSNAGLWEVDSITSDTELELVNPAVGNQSGITVSVAGRFYEADDPSDITLVQIPDVEFELIALTRYPSDDALILAEVMLDTGAGPRVNIIDRRGANLWRSVATRDTAYAPHLQLALNPQLTSPDTGASYDHDIPTIHSRPVVNVAAQPAIRSASIAPRSDGKGYVAIMASADGLRACQYHHEDDTWQDRNATGGGRNIIEGSSYAVARASLKIIPLPPQLGETHVVFYQRANVIYSLRTTDDFATVGSELTTWDLTADGLVYPGAGLEMLDVVMLRSGRLIMATCTGVVAADGVRFRYSDDYGVTWEDNGGGGWLLADSTLEYDPRLCEADDGTLVLMTRSNNRAGDTFYRRLDPFTFEWLDAPVSVLDPLAGPHKTASKAPATISAQATYGGVLLPGPNGGVWALEHFVYDATSSTDAALIIARYVTLDTMTPNRAITHYQLLLRVADGNPDTTSADLGLAACVGANGALEILCRRIADTTNGGIVDHYTALPVLLAAPWNHAAGPFDALIG